MRVACVNGRLTPKYTRRRTHIEKHVAHHYRQEGHQERERHESGGTESRLDDRVAQVRVAISKLYIKIYW